MVCWCRGLQWQVIMYCGTALYDCVTCLNLVANGITFSCYQVSLLGCHRTNERLLAAWQASITVAMTQVSYAYHMTDHVCEVLVHLSNGPVRVSVILDILLIALGSLCYFLVAFVHLHLLVHHVSSPGAVHALAYVHA